MVQQQLGGEKGIEDDTISTILENKNVKKQKLEKKLEKSTREVAATTTTITTTTTTTHKV